LVTGAGQGNGRAIALGLARAGARVVVTDVNATTVAETAALLRAEGATAWDFALDVTDAAPARRWPARVAADCGRVDLLVNNAGIIIRENSSTRRPPRHWRRTIDVNLHGTFNVTQALLPALKNGGGTIVNLSSIAAFAGQGGSLGYSPSARAPSGCTRSRWRSSWRPSACASMRWRPGVIATPMTEPTRADPSRLAGFLQRTPMGRVGQPEELVGPVLFLASDALSSYVTGVTLPVDGGFLAG
jgi:NAD(P)-dependent dehydrogenase (short-subunit alcohol dehydrogenase family)